MNYLKRRCLGLFLAIILITSNVYLKAGAKDSLYTKFDAIYCGLSFGAGRNVMLFDYAYYDIEGLRKQLTGGNLKISEKIIMGLDLKSKYGSAYVSLLNINNPWSMTGFFNYVSPCPKPSIFRFGYSFYPDKFKISMDYEQMKNIPFECLGSPYIRNTNFRKLNARSVYYFNKNFSFSKANSTLHFPKKSLFTFSLGTMYEGVSIYGDGQSFLSTWKTDTLGVETITFDYANKIGIHQFYVQPGFEFFLTRNSLKKPRKNYFFLHGRLETYAALYYSNTVCDNTIYNGKSKSYGYGLFHYSVGYGFVLRNFIIKWSYSKSSLYPVTNLVRFLNLKSQISMSLGYLIPSKKLYEKIDNKITAIKKSIFKKQ